MSAKMPRFEVYPHDGIVEVPSGKLAAEWRWRLLAGNGEIICSGEAFTRRSDAMRAVRGVKRAVLKIVEAEDLRAIAKLSVKR